MRKYFTVQLWLGALWVLGGYILLLQLQRHTGRTYDGGLLRAGELLLYFLLGLILALPLLRDWQPRQCSKPLLLTAIILMLLTAAVFILPPVQDFLMFILYLDGIYLIYPLFDALAVIIGALLLRSLCPKPKET